MVLSTSQAVASLLIFVGIGRMKRGHARCLGELRIGFSQERDCMQLLTTHSPTRQLPEHTSVGPTFALGGSACSRCPEATGPPNQTQTGKPVGP